MSAKLWMTSCEREIRLAWRVLKVAQVVWKQGMNHSEPLPLSHNMVKE